MNIANAENNVNDKQTQSIVHAVLPAVKEWLDSLNASDEPDVKYEDLDNGRKRVTLITNWAEASGEGADEHEASVLAYEAFNELAHSRGVSVDEDAPETK